ncbi:MAG: hypothetical protein AAF560_10200 [Acidobacteriota bacterium]
MRRILHTRNRLALAACLTALAGLAYGDVLVTQDGERIETEGAWEVKGRQVVYTDARGVLSAMRLADVDLEASEQATRAAREQQAAPATAPTRAAPRKATRSFTNDDIGAAPDNVAEAPAATEEQEPGAENLSATFGTVANGYSVRVSCNGRVLPGITGGQSQAVQLFHTDHPNRAKMEADLAVQDQPEENRQYLNLFCLQEGSNTIDIGYEPTGPSNLNLKFYLNAPNYTSAIWEFEQEERVAGTFSTSFEIYREMPEDHQTRILR